MCVCRNGKRGQGWERKYVVLDGTKVSIYEIEPREGCFLLLVQQNNTQQQFVDLPEHLTNTASGHRHAVSLSVIQIQWSHWKSLTCVYQMERWLFMEQWGHLSYPTPPSQVLYPECAVLWMLDSPSWHWLACLRISLYPISYLVDSRLHWKCILEESWFSPAKWSIVWFHYNELETIKIRGSINS